MKAQKLFTLDVEIIEELKRSGENQSQLVNSLLNSHFKRLIPREELAKQLDYEINEKLREKDDIVRIVERDKEKKAKMEKEEEIKELEKLNSPERWARIETNQKEAFSKWNAPIEEFQEFFNKLRTGEIKNILEFMEKKGYKRKEKNPLFN